MNKIDHIMSLILDSYIIVLDADKETLSKIKHLKYVDGYYEWIDLETIEQVESTRNIRINITEEKCFQLRFKFKDGHEHIVKPDFEIDYFGVSEKKGKK